MKTWTLRLAKIVAAILVAAILLHVALLVASGLALRNARAELRAAGRPMHPDDIIPQDVPASENAAPLYETAFALLVSESVDGKELSSYVNSAGLEFSLDPDSNDKRIAFENALSNPTLVQAFNLIRKASERPQCNFDLPYEQGALMLIPHVNGMLVAGRILSNQALLATERGDGQNAWQSAILALRMADSLREEPVLISALVRIAMFEMALASVQKVANAFPPDAETLEILDPLIAAADDLQPVLRAFDGERLFFGEWIFDGNNVHRLIQDAMAVGLPSPQPRPIVWLFSYRPTRQFHHAAYLRILKQATSDIAIPLSQAHGAPETMQDRWYGGVLHSFVPAFYRTRVNTLKLQATARVTRTGIALLRHQAAHGAYPATLAEIDPRFLPEIHLDPFTGQPLVYRPEGDGFLLYSLGENLADDGGTEESKDNRESKAFDVVWRMPR